MRALFVSVSGGQRAQSAPGQPSRPRRSATRASSLSVRKPSVCFICFLKTAENVYILQNLYLFNRDSEYKVFYMFLDQKNV
jgi:hypothetical protein